MKKKVGRTNEDSVKRSITIREPTDKLVRAYAKKKGIPYSRAIDIVLAAFLNRIKP